MMRVLGISRRGISMAETVISTMLIGFVLVATLQIVGPMVRSTSVAADDLIASNLAIELSEEIGTKVWTTPLSDDPDSIGPGAGEKRATFDDIDDYHGWSSSPPKLSNGISNVNLGDWTRSVRVAHVEFSDLTTESPTYTGIKRVTVTVSKNGTVLAEVHSLHTKAADTFGFIVP
jgi:Tfp pilus assembly protein PilV